MGAIFVKGLGTVRIAGDTPTAEEAKAITEAASMRQYGPGIGRPATPQEVAAIPEDRLPFYQRPSFKSMQPGDKKVTAFLYGLGTGIGNLARGVEQIVGLTPSQAAQEGVDFQKYARTQGELRTPAAAGRVTGTLVDPIALAIPVGRGASVVRRAVQGAEAGATVGALVPVEPGQSRARNAITGAVAGGVLNPLVHAGLDAVTGAPRAPFYGRVPKAVETGVPAEGLAQIKASGAAPFTPSRAQPPGAPPRQLPPPALVTPPPERVPPLSQLTSEISRGRRVFTGPLESTAPPRPPVPDPTIAAATRSAKASASYAAGRRVNPEQDDLLTAVSKLGGLSREDGVGPCSRGRRSPRSTGPWSARTD